MIRKPKAKRFEELLEELEATVAKLESDDLDLEEAIRAFERGMELSRQCHARLDEAERKVKLLKRRPGGGVEEEEFSEGEEGES